MILNIERNKELEMSNTFTDKAKSLWNSISPGKQELLLNNVWCTNCIKTTTITNYDGKVEGDDLILTGTCAMCGGKVARVIEGG
jgi:hypothetical protein